MPAEQLRARAVHVYRRARWYAGQARRMTREQGIAQTMRRGRSFVGRRALPRQGPRKLPPPAASTPAAPELPSLPADAWSHWPLSLVIMGDQDESRAFRYRVEHKQAMAESFGIPVVLADVRDPDAARSAMQLGSALIVQQPSPGEHVQALLREARRLGQMVFFDYDGPPPAVPRDSVEPEAPDLVLCSSRALALQLGRNESPQALVVPNGIDEGAFHLVQNLALDPQVRKWSQDGEGVITLALASSCRLQAADILLACDGLRVAMERYPNVRLKVFSSVPLPDTMKPFASRVFRVRYETYGEYLRNLAMSHIVLAPLEASGFNQATSPTLYLESALLERPMIASHTMYEDHVTDGVTALLARSADDWIQHLDRLIADAGMRDRIGEAARKDLEGRRLAAVPTASFQTVISEISQLGAGRR